MKVYLHPQGLHSRAMVRVANALSLYAPRHVQVVNEINKADVVILHVIGSDGIERASRLLDKHQQYVIIQYCLKSSGLPNEHSWLPCWKNARLVWSYYPLSTGNEFNFYHAPLGIDDAFLCAPYCVKERLMITTGYVNGAPAEAISEVWQAAAQLNIQCVHVGPNHVANMSEPANWQSVQDISDEQLSILYSRATWVAALRYVEGFELPALEGLSCRARPIVFNRPDMTQWYGRYAYMIDECQGEELVSKLVECLSQEVKPVSDSERDEVVARFDWSVIARGFWNQLGV